MLPIPAQPSKIGTVLTHDDFFFASKNRNNIPVPEFSIIINSANYDQYICAIPRVIDLNGSRVPFYLQHTDLFINAQSVYRNLFGIEPDILLIYAYKNDSTKSAFLFSNRKFINDASVNRLPITFNYSPQNKTVAKEIESKIKNETNSNRKINNIIIENGVFRFTLPTGIFPVIGAYNDLTAEDKNPSFNLIFGSFFSDKFYQLNIDLNREYYEETTRPLNNVEESHEWESQVDSKLRSQFSKGIPLYCIKNFNLKNPSYYGLFNPNNMNTYYQNVNEKCADDFVLVISNLLLSYSRGGYLPTTSDEFAACLPHFYKVDRTKHSVKNTLSLQTKLRNIYDTATNFGLSIPNLNFKDFIEFFILESIIDFDVFLANPGQELYKALVHKRTMSQLVGENEILTRFLSNTAPNNDYSLFVDNQVNAKAEIDPFL